MDSSSNQGEMVFPLTEFSQRANRLAIVVDHKGKLRVFDRGVEIKMIKSLVFKAEARNIPTLTLEFLVAD